MRKILFFLTLSLLFSSIAFAGIFIYEPQDKLTSFDDVIILGGTSKYLEILKINNEPIKINPDGSFKCGLVLRDGKNYVEVRALDKFKQHFVEKIRVLGLKTYPDLETLYEGKKHWARTQVIYLSSLGFIEGYPDDYFYPGNPITRGELATWIARVKKLDIPKLTKDVFFDVPKEHWRAPFIRAVVDAGYIKGYDNQTFGIDDPISRRNAAAIVVVTEGVGVVEKVKPLFIDVPKAEKGAFPIYVAKEKGLVKGVYEDLPVFEPDRALTRAEAAVLLARFNRSQDAIQWLFNFKKGFSPASFCKINVPPEITSFAVEPASININEKSTIRIRAQIAPRENFSPVSKVKVDLTSIGGMPDVKMYDDGTHGDQEKDDLIFSLNLSLEPKQSGSRTLTVIAIDRLGWESKAETSFLILE